MVILKAWILGLCHLLLVLGVLRQPLLAEELSPVRISGTEIVLGEFVTLEVRGKANIRQFERLPLASMRKQFAFEVSEASSERLRIRLYPFESGEFELPSMLLSGQKTDSVRVKVQPNNMVALQWGSVENSYYPQELVVQKVSVSLPKSQWKATLEQPINLPESAWQFTPLTPSQQTGLLGAHDVQFGGVFQYTDLLQPLQTLTKQLPILHLKVRRPNGRVWDFYSPPKTVQLIALPSFVPSNSVVADLSWQTPTAWLNPLGEITEWQWQFKAENVDISYLQTLANQIAQQLSAAQGVEWLTPTIETQSQPLVNGVEQRLTLRIPFRPTNWIWFTPQIQFGYFHPDTQKWQQTILPAGHHLSLPPVLIGFAKLLSSILLVMLAWMLLQMARKLWAWRQLGQRLRTATTAQQLAQALFAWQKALQGEAAAPAVPTLGQWQQWHQSRFENSVSEELVKVLQTSLFSEKTDTQTVQATAQTWYQSQAKWKLVKGSFFG